MSLADLLAAIRMVLDILARARALRTAGANATANARNQLAALAHGTGNPTLAHATASLATGVGALDEGELLLASAMSDIVAYGRRLGSPLAPPAPPRLTTPSYAPDPNARPRGERTPAHPTKVDAQPLRRENESADVLAGYGYDVEQNPPPKPNGKEPDYRVEGRYFDCYAPTSGDVDQVRKGISRKVKRDQADRIVLSLADTSVTRQDLAHVLHRRPIENLKEVVLVDGKHVVPFYPFRS